MKRFFIISILSGIISVPAFAALQEGASAPIFEAPASWAGKTLAFSLKDSLKKGPVVVYFYPSAFTGGCNIQAHTFSVNQEKFAAAGATIVGVSQDSIARLNDFSADPEYCAGKFAVVSDVDGKISKAYDLNVRDRPTGRKDSRGTEIDHALVERTTFIVTPDGKISNVVGGVAPEENVNKALQAVQKLATNPSKSS